MALSKELVMEVVDQYDHNRTCLSTMMAEVNRKLANKKLSDTDKKKMKAWMLEAVAAREEGEQERQIKMKERPCGQKRKMEDMENTIVPTHRVHTINPDKPVLCAAAPSDKKTSLCETTTDFLTRSAWAPTYIKQQQVFAVDGSVRGLREAITHFKRVSCTTDEIVAMIHTPWSESGSNVYIPRSKLCTFSQGERDDVLTANGPIHLRSYAFQLRACGQLEPVEPRKSSEHKLIIIHDISPQMHHYQSVSVIIDKTKRHLNNSHRRTEEYIMKPGPQGWFKRPCLRVSMGNNEQVDDFPAEVATGLLRPAAKSQENIQKTKEYLQRRKHIHPKLWDSW